MDRYFSPLSGGFLVDPLAIPSDAVPITLEEHMALLAECDRGRRVALDEAGRPVAEDRPGPQLEDIVAAKAREIRAGYDTALSGVLAGADATATGVAVGSALMAVTDPQGLEYLVDMLTVRRVALEQALLAAQADADPVATVLAIVVSYPT